MFVYIVSRLQAFANKKILALHNAMRRYQSGYAGFLLLAAQFADNLRRDVCAAAGDNERVE